MPTLKQLTCSIELGTTNIKLKEYDKTYGDGKIEAYIAIPDVKVPFHVHVTSEGYIAPGIAVFVFIDGIYHTNRNITGLKLPGADVKISQYEIDLRLRQKEEKNSNGMFVGREWTFAALGNATNDNAQPTNPNFAKNVGTIEVVVLRCRNSGQTIVTTPPEPHYSPSKDPKPAKSVLRKTTQEESEIGGLFGLFDGAGDEARRERYVKPTKANNGMSRYFVQRLLLPENEPSDNPLANGFVNLAHLHHEPGSHPGLLLPEFPKHNDSPKPIDPSYHFEKGWGPDTPVHSAGKTDSHEEGIAIFSPGGHPPPWTLHREDEIDHTGFDNGFNVGLDGHNADHFRKPIPENQPAPNLGRPGVLPVYGAPGPFPILQPQFGLPAHLPQAQNHNHMPNVPQNAYNMSGVYAAHQQPPQNYNHMPSVPQNAYNINGVYTAPHPLSQNYIRKMNVPQNAYNINGMFAAPQPPSQNYNHMLNIPQNAYNINGVYAAPQPGCGMAPQGGPHLPYIQPAMLGYQATLPMRKPATSKKEEIEKLTNQIETANEVLKICKDEIKKLGKSAGECVQNDYVSNRDRLRQIDKQLREQEDHERKVKAQIASIQHKLDSLNKSLNAGADHFYPYNPEAADHAKNDFWITHSDSKSQCGEGKDQNNHDDWLKQGSEQNNNHNWFKQGNEQSPGWVSGAKDDKNNSSAGDWGQNDNNGWDNSPAQVQIAAWGANANENDAAAAAAAWELEPQTPEEKALDGQVARNTELNSGRSHADSIHSMKVKPYFADWQKSTDPTDPTPSKSKDAKKRTVTIREPYEYAAVPLPNVTGGEGPNGASLGVQAGRGAIYSHRRQRPDYLDTMEAPYAVFSFKYRTKDALEKILKHNIDDDFEKLNDQARIDALHALPKSQLIEKLTRISSPHPTSVEEVADKSVADKIQNGWGWKSDNKSAADKSQNGWGGKSDNKSVKNGWDNDKGGKSNDDDWNNGPGAPKNLW
ncbi:Hypothetical protein R9X50_00077500 [Acrodontium crateriforme]|uniref:Uncharacterized protein n=1 Tax=Acrodontium crateriforme TaxID=150365 RepID=A0AAQ3LYG6_9PEZI|nr:Hypothetical protein R9X50_00077500 [Acrodontium crateriforme]